MTNLGLGETEKPKTVRQLMSPSGRVRWDRKGPQLGDATRTFFLYFAYSAFTTVAAVAGSSPSALGEKGSDFLRFSELTSRNRFGRAFGRESQLFSRALGLGGTVRGSRAP